MFDTVASDSTATEAAPAIFSLCVMAGAGTTATSLEASIEVTLTFSGKGGSVLVMNCNKYHIIRLSSSLLHTIRGC